MLQREATARRSFTLIELLVVIAVIAMLAGLLLPALLTGGTSGRIQTTRALLSQVSMAATQWQDAYGRIPPVDDKQLPPSIPTGTLGSGWPSSSALLVLLVYRETDAKRSPYLTVKDTFKLKMGSYDVIIDGFASPIVYDPVVPPIPLIDDLGKWHLPLHNAKTYDLFSAGPYASRITALGTKLPDTPKDFEDEALKPNPHDTKGGCGATQYTYEAYDVAGTNLVNKYIGNW